jgi:hypothetical protein
VCSTPEKRHFLGYAQALFRHAQACSPSAQVCSPSAQVKAAAAHVRRLKRNQRKKKLILSPWVSALNIGRGSATFPLTATCTINSPATPLPLKETDPLMPNVDLRNFRMWVQFPFFLIPSSKISHAALKVFWCI